MPNLPANTCIYAIGDIHGRADLLEQLHGRIRHDAEKYPDYRKIIVYLGDYIDRGNSSRQVIDQLLNPTLTEFTAIHLRGNHESMLLEFLKNPARGELWFMNGGMETLMSYNVSLSLLNQLNYEKVATALAANLPLEHLQFFASLKTHHIEGNYYFCHAGINPNIPLDKQTDEDLIWIREPFLSSQKDFGKIIVHGHTVSQKPTLRANQIGVDTGAVFTNHLTCAVLTQNKPYFLST
jgi:serine/threonine protein phosphatase 1